jgi:F-type H+-transporting ATPase subunit a
MTFVPHLFAEEEGLPQAPVRLFSIGGFEINNSMIAAILVAAVIIVVVQLAMRSPKLIPSIAGRDTMRRGFWFFASLLVFIFAENFFALLPGVGTFGYGHGEGWDFKVTQPFLRGANANDNLTAAYAAIFFVMWFYWVFRQIGVWGAVVDIFGSKVKFPNLILHYLFVVIFFLVGIMEFITIIFVRPIAFTFRLYGNIYGGESFLDTIFHTAPNAFLATFFLIPGYMWEFIVAFVQALVFFILTVVFTGILTNSSAHAPHSDKKEAH